MISCEQFAERVTPYLEGRVPYGERLGLWMHSVLCPHCRKYLRQMAAVVDMMGDLDGRESVDEEMKADLMNAYRKKKGEES